MYIKPEPRIIDGEMKYCYGEVPFDTFEAAQEYIDKEILKISPEFENMSDEERKAEFDEMANKSDLSVSDSLQT